MISINDSYRLIKFCDAIMNMQIYDFLYFDKLCFTLSFKISSCAPLSDILSDSLFMLSQVRKRRRLLSEKLRAAFVLIVGIYIRYTLIILIMHFVPICMDVWTLSSLY